MCVYPCGKRSRYLGFLVHSRSVFRGSFRYAFIAACLALFLEAFRPSDRFLLLRLHCGGLRGDAVVDQVGDSVSTDVSGHFDRFWNYTLMLD